MTLWIGNVYEGSTTLSLILYKKKKKVNVKIIYILEEKIMLHMSSATE